MEKTIDQTKGKNDSRQMVNVWALSGELGIIIVLPLVILILIGIKIDRALGTTPLFIIVAMLFSFILSTITIARKIKRLQP